MTNPNPTIPPALARAGRIYFALRTRQARALHSARYAASSAGSKQLFDRAASLDSRAERWWHARFRLASSG